MAYMPMQLGMVVQQRFVGLEATHDIFRRLQPVYTHDHLRVVVQQPAKLTRTGSSGGAVGGVHDLRRVYGKRIGTGEQPVAPPDEPSLVEIYTDVGQEASGAFKKVACVLLGLEAEHVIGGQPLEDLQHEALRQKLPVAHSRPGNVDELLDAGAR